LFSYGNDSRKNRSKKSRASVPLKSYELQKTPGGKKYIISSYSAAKVESAEGKLSSCGLEVADFRNNCDCGVAVAEQHSFKSCGIAIAEALPASCRIAIVDSKKSCACPPLVSIGE
jgi:hypothetical protein